MFDTNESGIGNVTVTLTGTNDLGQTVSLTTTTSNTGAYSFSNLRPGTYTLTETQPAGYLEGHDNVGSLGGSAAVIDVFSGVAATAGANGTNYNFGEILPASVTGYVYNDANDNGVFDTTESGIGGVTITLTGTNDLGQTIDLTTTTSSTGAYSFAGLRPGTYSLTETPPAGYTDGKDTVGTEGGVVGHDQFTAVVLVSGQNGANNDFAELLSLNASVSIDKYVEVTPTSNSGCGCSSGFWQQDSGCSDWCGCHSSDSFNSIFGVNDRSCPTLQGAIGECGDGSCALDRQAVAAYLNACNPNIHYAYSSPAGRSNGPRRVHLRQL